jgi:protein-S-isoprenylcysteine O-methyltransferase Ste14
MYWYWQPMTSVVWEVTNSTGVLILQVIFALGWLIVLLSTFMINHFDLFGLRQVYLNFKGAPYEHLPFTVKYLYRFARHPIMLGFMIAFWAAPVMTMGHLIFAIATTVYMYLAVSMFEEKDLVAIHGESYQDYQKKVPMFIPFTKKGS